MAFLETLHVSYIESLKTQKPSLESCMTEHMKVSGIYWGITAMSILNKENNMDPNTILTFLTACSNNDGGYGGNIGHDSHLLYTCHAILIYAVLDALDSIDKEGVVKFVASLQDDNDGSFSGDQYGEKDIKFTYCALLITSVLKKRDAINIPSAMDYVAKCQNFDGGYGNLPQCESHGGHIFTAIGSLALGKAINKVDGVALGWWLCERQCDSGGLNGRPEKQADVCYSWWNISSLIMIGKLKWINTDKLIAYILACQDPEEGGIADRPGNCADVYHTFFGIGGLSLLGYFEDPEVIAKMPFVKTYRKIHPVFAIPTDIVESLQLEYEIEE